MKFLTEKEILNNIKIENEFTHKVIGNIKQYSFWILIVILYLPVFVYLYTSKWETIDYTHAYFILPVFFFLVWRKRNLFSNSVQATTSSTYASALDRENGQKALWIDGCPSSPLDGFREVSGWSSFISSFIGILTLVFGLSMFIFGWRHGYIFFKTLSLLPVLFGSVAIINGLSIARALFFPILYLILLVPIPLGLIDSITLPMRNGVSIATVGVLKFFQYPISREGLLLYIGGSELFVGQPCSGFRSLITLFSTGLIYVFLSKVSISKKAILAFSIIPLALLGNLVRIIILCLITFYFGVEAGQGFFHNFSGILVIILITIGLLGLEYLLRKWMPNTSRPTAKVHVVRQGNERYQYANKNLWIVNALLLFTIIFCFGYVKTREKYEGSDILSQLEIPLKIKNWIGEDVEQSLNLEESKYYFIAQAIQRKYTSINGEHLFLTILGGRDFHNPKVCSKGVGFEVEGLSDIELQTPNHMFKTHAIFTQMRDEAEGFMLIYWFCADKKVVDWFGEKMKSLWISLMDEKTPGLMIRIDVPCISANINDAVQLARRFIAELDQSAPQETTDCLFGKIGS